MRTAPLGRGILTGQIKSIDDLPETDHRRALPRFQPGAFETNLKLVEQVNQIASRKGCTPGQIAINWLVSLSKRPGMPKIIPIPGTTSVARVAENSKIVELTDEDMADIDRILKEFPLVGDRLPEFAKRFEDKTTL